MGQDSDSSVKKFTGTSAACPHVAGAAALLLSDAMKLNKFLKAKALKRTLKKHAKSGVKNAGTESPDKRLWLGSDWRKAMHTKPKKRKRTGTLGGNSHSFTIAKWAGTDNLKIVLR